MRNLHACSNLNIFHHLTFFRSVCRCCIGHTLVHFHRNQPMVSNPARRKTSDPQNAWSRRCEICFGAGVGNIAPIIVRFAYFCWICQICGDSIRYCVRGWGDVSAALGVGQLQKSVSTTTPSCSRGPTSAGPKLHSRDAGE